MWVSDIPGFGKARLRVRGFTSPYVVAHRARLERAVPRDQRTPDGNLNPATAMQVFGQTLYDVILLEWDGFVRKTGELSDDGKTPKTEPVPFDKVTALKWCTDKNYLPFQDGVTYAANYVDRAQGAKTDIDAGN
jgi:hypothetical protein